MTAPKAKTAKDTTKTVTIKKTPVRTNKRADPMFGFVTDFLIESKASNKLREEWNQKEKDFVKFKKSQEKKLSNKRPKDPNAPKKPTSAYIFFCNDKREDVKRKNPNMKVTEIIKEIAAEWRSTPDKKKSAYTKKAQQDKERYLKECETYIPPPGYASTVQKKTKRNTGRSGYLIYCDEHRPKIKENNPTMKGKEVLSLLGKNWSALTDKQKEKYKAKAKAEKEQKEKEQKANTEDEEEVTDEE